MSLQRIINRAESISINRRRVIGIQYSKSQIATTVETVTRNPWQFTIKMAAYLPYNNIETRNIIETIDQLDRNHFEDISMSSNSNLAWMFAYKGEMLPTQLSLFSVYSFSGNQLVLQNSFTGVVAGTVAFRAGDFIQIEGHPYPFTVRSDVIVTSQAIVSGLITVITHRPNFLVNSVAGNSINIGNNVQFRMFCNNMPTYSIVAGAGSNGGYITFDSDFVFYEWTATEI